MTGTREDQQRGMTLIRYIVHITRQTKGGQSDNFNVPLILITFWLFSFPINCSNCS